MYMWWALCDIKILILTLFSDVNLDILLLLFDTMRCKRKKTYVRRLSSVGVNIERVALVRTRLIKTRSDKHWSNKIKRNDLDQSIPSTPNWRTCIQQGEDKKIAWMHACNAHIHASSRSKAAWHDVNSRLHRALKSPAGRPLSRLQSSTATSSRKVVL